MKPTLTLADYQRAAQTLGCKVAAIMAVASVESSGNGFYTDGSLKKKFEAHWFRYYTGKSVSTYTQAYAIDPKSAMLSTSWGKFQIMGFNHKIAGYTTVQAMVDAFNKNEQAHLSGFIGFIEAKKLEDELRNLNWTGFAYTYNGENYAKLGYHTKMAAAYAKFSTDPAIAEAEAEVKKKA